MADIRIKDITTTASASLTGDVFVIDGTTGTRKLSAFNPTFGGNAVVTGTLTVNSTSSFVGNATLQGSALWLNDGGGGTFNFVNGSTVANTLRLGIGNTNQVLITDTKTTILATTASTSTSSGALVVSGGVGVAGNAYVGGALVVSGGIDNTIAGNVQFSTGQIRVTNAYTPLSASASGAVGSITWDNVYIYVCVATNTWKRVAISSW